MRIEIIEGPHQDTVDNILDVYKRADRIEHLYRNIAGMRKVQHGYVWLRSELRFLESVGINSTLVSALMESTDRRMHQGSPASSAMHLSQTRKILYRGIFAQYCRKVG